MKFSRVASGVILSILMTGCASIGDVFPSGKKPEAAKPDGVMDALASAARDVGQEIRKLNEGIGASLARQPMAAPAPGCMTKIVSIDFDGDVMLFIDDFRKNANCGIRVIGKKPPQEIILSLHHKKVPLWQVLEDAGAQLGSLASIGVTSNAMVVSFQ